MSGGREVPVAVLARPARSGWGRLAVALALVAAVFLGAGRLGDLLPSIPNPFASDSVDRSQPALLQSIENLSRYQAASGNLQVIVDTEDDARFVPSFIRGERTVFVAAGTVEATVDFSRLDERAIVVSPDRTSVTVTLPPPTLSEPVVDPAQSRVATRQRGLLDRIGSAFSDSPTSDRGLYLLAQDKRRAAADATDLRARAEQNTRQMLEGMLGSLGFTTVTVNFAPDPA
jgi:hypothetical protein